MADRPRRTIPPVPNTGYPRQQWAGDGHGTRGGNQARPDRTFYSGDGHGKSHSWQGDGNSEDRKSALDPWSGDGHGKRVRAAMPLWVGQTHGYNTMPTSADWMDSPNIETAVRNSTVAVPTLAGDGRTNESLDQLGLAEDLVMEVNMPVLDGSTMAGLKTKPTPKSETWKLVMLVVVFLLWISTASTLLFLYMDQYLFP